MTNADVNMRIGGVNGARLVTPEYTPSFSVDVDDVTVSASAENDTLTASDIIADLAVTLAAPSGWEVHDVANIDEIANWRGIYFGLGVEVGDQILFDTTTAAVDADGLVTGAASVSFYWYDDDLDGGTWSAIQTWISYALVVQDVELSLTTDSTYFPGDYVAALAVTLNPPTGYSVHTVTDISQAADEGCIYYSQSPAIAVGDQILYDSTTGTNAWPVAIDSQGFWTIDSSGGTSDDTWSYQIFDATDETWGLEGTISMQPSAAGADSALGLSIGSPTLTQHHILAVQGATVGAVAGDSTLGFTGSLAVQGVSISLSVDGVTLNGPDQETITGTALRPALVVSLADAA
jgi:hypothetical protein